MPSGHRVLPWTFDTCLGAAVRTGELIDVPIRVGTRGVERERRVRRARHVHSQNHFWLSRYRAVPGIQKRLHLDAERSSFLRRCRSQVPACCVAASASRHDAGCDEK